MTVTIIERGEAPEDQPIETKCRRCRTRFSFVESDALRQSDPRDGDYLKLPCPVCEAPVTVAL